MSGYGEMIRDQQQAEWTACWVPEDDKDLPEPTMANLRHNIARARDAEDKLRRLRESVNGLRSVLREI